MATLFDLQAVIRLDSNQFENGVKKAEKSGSSLATSLKSGLATAAKVGAAAVGAAATAIGALTTAAVNNYAEYEQLIGGVETLYGAKYKTIEEYIKGTGTTAEAAEETFAKYQERQQKVLDNAANAYKTAGMSANEYMNTVNGFAASLTSSLGEYEWQAANYADMIVSDMADNANKMGTSMESIQNAYAGFAKQNYTMLDNLKLGYGGTKEEMERLLRDAEKIAGYTKGSLDIESFADVADAINIIQEEMGITGTTAKEAASTIQGSIASMKSAWSNLVTGIADENAEFGTLINNFVESASTVLGNILPRIEESLYGVDALVYRMFPIIMERIPKIISDFLPRLVETAAMIVQSIVDGILDNTDVLIDSAIEIIDVIVDKLIENLPKLIEGGIKLTLGLAEGLIKALPKLLSKTPQIIRGIVSSLVKNLPDIISVGADIVKGIWKGITGMGDWLWNNVKGFFNGIVDGVKGILGIHSPSKVFAGIGENMALGLGKGWNGEFDAVKKSVNGDMDFVGSYTPSIATAKANTASSTASQNNTDTLLTAILNKLDGMGVYLDGTTLTGYVDSRLGKQTEDNRRFVMA